jgi:hypothetical protein
MTLGQWWVVLLFVFAIFAAIGLAINPRGENPMRKDKP